MSMNVAHFPLLGPIEDPTIKQYEIEVALQETDPDRPRAGASGPYWERWREWRQTLRRLEWSQSAREMRERSQSSPSALPVNVVPPL